MRAARRSRSRQGSGAALALRRRGGEGGSRGLRARGGRFVFRRSAAAALDFSPVNDDAGHAPMLMGPAPFNLSAPLDNAA